MSKPPKPPEELSAIDPTTLSQVTGGTSSLAADSNALVGQVTDILGSIKNINNVSSQQGIKPQEMMLFMMLLKQQQAPQTTVVAAPSVSWWGGRGWS